MTHYNAGNQSTYRPNLFAVNGEYTGAVQSDEHLVRLLKHGHRAAFDTLVHKYQPRLMSIASRFVNESDVSDVVQESLIKAYVGLSGFKGRSTFYTWLYRITVNTAKNHLRRSSRPLNGDVFATNHGDLSDNNLDRYIDTTSPEELLLADELNREVVFAIDSLPERMRSAITMRDLEGLSYEEIANRMECPIGTIRTRICRARGAVNHRIKPLRSL